MPYEALVSPGIFPITPSHFGVGENNYLLSSVSLSSGTHKIPKLKIWQGDRRSSQKIQNWHLRSGRRQRPNDKKLKQLKEKQNKSKYLQNYKREKTIAFRNLKVSKEHTKVNKMCRTKCFQNKQTRYFKPNTLKIELISYLPN